MGNLETNNSYENSELLTFANNLYQFSTTITERLGVKDINETKKRGLLQGKELSDKQEHFKQFLDLPAGYEVGAIFLDGETHEYKMQILFTPEKPDGFQTKIGSTLTFKKEYIGKAKSMVYKNSAKPEFYDSASLSGTYTVNGSDFVCEDTVFDIPNLTDQQKNYKKIPFQAEYNEQKTDKHCMEKLETATTSFDNISIDKNIPNDIKNDIFYTEEDKNGRSYENSILNQFNLTSHLKGIQLDKNTRKEGEYYIKKLMIKNGSENIPLDIEVKYKIDPKGKLVIDQNSLGNKSITVDGFTFNNLSIETDASNPLNVKITFDNNELKQYGDHMKKGIVETYKTVMKASFSGNQDFSNLNDKVNYYQGDYSDSINILNIKNLEGYYHLKLNSTTSLPLEWDGNSVKLKDKYGQNVDRVAHEYLSGNKKMSTFAEIKNNRLSLSDKPEKVKDYKYFDFELQGMNYQNVQGHFQEGGNPNFLLTGQTGGQVKNLSEFNVDYDPEKGYSLDKSKNKITLEPKYFYNELPKIGKLSGKVAGFSDVAIKELFDKKFEESGLKGKEFEGAIVDNQFCGININGNKITFKKNENPAEVTKIINDITNLINATTEISNYTVEYNGQPLENNIGGVNGYGSYFKIDDINNDNPSLHCYLTNLNDSGDTTEADIKFDYKKTIIGSNFSLSNDTKKVLLDDTNASVSVKDNKIILKTT